MADRQFRPMQGSLTNRVACLYGQVVLGSTGAISSQTSDGFSVAKTGGEVGRYTVTLNDVYNKLLGVSCNVVGATDAAYTTANGVFSGLLRNNAVATAKTFDIQMQRTDTGADAEVEDNLTLLICISVKNSGV